MLKYLFAALALLLAAPAHADLFNSCGGGGCLFDPEFGPFRQDYSLPTDGHTYQWDFRIESEDPEATLSLGRTNQIDIYAWQKLSDGRVIGAPVDWDFSWVMIRTAKPGLVSYEVRAPASYNDCDKPDAIGHICGVQYNFWGNGTPLTISSTAPMRVFFSVTAIPEPSTWALMIAGFGACGVMLRRQRRARPA